MFASGFFVRLPCNTRFFFQCFLSFLFSLFQSYIYIYAPLLFEIFPPCNINILFPNLFCFLFQLSLKLFYSSFVSKCFFCIQATPSKSIPIFILSNLLHLIFSILQSISYILINVYIFFFINE